MLNNITAVSVLDGYRLALQFANNVSGEVDVAAIAPFDGVFRRLRARSYFGQVRADHELGTICWPNGADIDADVLYGAATGTQPRFDVVPVEHEAYAARWRALVAEPEVQRILHETLLADPQDPASMVETKA